ncbi:MAG: hypothetical protein ACYDCF_11325, partial [Burkholderiales bacterium]
ELGRDFGVEVEVLSGIEPTDRIVDSPPDSLEDGDLVKVSNNSSASKAEAEKSGTPPAQAGKKP